MKTMKASKKYEGRVAARVPADKLKIFKKRIAEQGMTVSQWIRHQVIKYSK